MTIKQKRVWVLAAILSCHLPAARMQAQAASPATGSVADQATTEQTRVQLLNLLRVSPTLTAVVASDPSLLGNQEYVSKTNPDLAKFIGQHPEIARNPEFYLFADIHSRGPNRVRALERRVWSGEPEPQYKPDSVRIVDQIVPMLVAFAVISAIAWLIKLLLANRRWNRIFRLQTEVHGKLIDRLDSSQEILNYMQTDAGRRFLEAAPISIDVQQEERWPSVLQRVLTPLTAGVVMTLLGAGLLLLRHALRGSETPLLLFGVITMMPGFGCIISAAITWVLVKRLGLMPSVNRNGL